ncbi:unnamed protein product [Timema podura]|uniref:Uncharacterized protein n=1 Tax=Timema podura TaxID=61482 RepID=A0ABN7NII9_TIMPD|nr:unnamed protein product [Timema podura]
MGEGAPSSADDSLDDYNNENNLERLLPNSDKFLQLYRDSAARAVGHNSMDPGSTPGELGKKRTSGRTKEEVRQGGRGAGKEEDEGKKNMVEDEVGKEEYEGNDKRKQDEVEGELRKKEDEGKKEKKKTRWKGSWEGKRTRGRTRGIQRGFLISLQTILFDLPLQTGVRPSGWELRPSPQGLLLQQLLPLQSVGGKLQMSTHGTLSKMGEVGENSGD